MNYLKNNESDEYDGGRYQYDFCALPMNDGCQHTYNCSAYQLFYQVQQSDARRGLQMTDIEKPEQIQRDSADHKECRDTCCYLCPGSVALSRFQEGDSEKQAG